MWLLPQGPTPGSSGGGKICEWCTGPTHSFNSLTGGGGDSNNESTEVSYCTCVNPQYGNTPDITNHGSDKIKVKSY